MKQQGLKAKINHREVGWKQRGMQNPVGTSEHGDEVCVGGWHATLGILAMVGMAAY